MKKTFFIFLSIFLFSLIYEAKANICDLPLNLRKPEKIKILRLIESIMPVEPVNLIMKPTEPSKPTRLIYYRLHPINFCMT